MYIAMNRFHVNAGREEVFEEIWRTRDSYLDQVPGFKEFHLLKLLVQNAGRVLAGHPVFEGYEVVL